MSGLTVEDRAAEEQKLRDLAQQLRDLKACTAGAAHEATIESFASQADKFADLIRDAVTPELAAEAAAKAATKSASWAELAEMLSYSIQVEHETPEEALANMKAAVEEAEAKMRRTAEQLRAVADGGSTSVFEAIGAIATEAQRGLDEFLAAETDEDKLEVYGRVEESRTRWLANMETMQSTVADGGDGESNADTEAPDPLEPAMEACVPEPSYGMSCNTTGGGYGGYGGYSSYGLGGGCVSSAPTPITNAIAEEEDTATGSAQSRVVVPAPPALSADITPKQAREQLLAYLQNEEDGFLVTLRKAVAKVKEDERFQGVHDDADKLLEQMELASGAVIPEALVQDFSDDVAGAEDKLKATVEPMRKAQWGGFYAKKAGFTVRKYDLYVRKGKMPKLADEHAELLECATVAVDLGEFLRKEAQGAIMDSVTGLVAATTTTR